MREQVKKYYNIDRKLVSSDYMEVIEGLNELNSFIDTLEISEIYNSVVMRLIDLFTNTKTNYIRIKAAHIINRTSKVIPYLPSLQQVINSLSKNLKQNDEIIRILAMQIIEKSCHIFHKQNSIYHYLLSKLRREEDRSIKEKFGAVKCLRALLGYAKGLSKLFSQNINQLNQIGGIQLKFLIYLSCYANFQPCSYPDILNTFWQMLKLNQQKTVAYFKKFLIRAFNQNFKCCLIFQQKLNGHFPQLQKSVNELKALKYFFLTEDIDLTSFDNSALLDMAYHIKISNNLEYISKISAIFESRIHLELSNMSEPLSYEVLFMSFFCFTDFDQRFHAKLSNVHKLSEEDMYNHKLLKICLVTGNFFTANVLIEQQLNQIHEKYEGFLLLKAYIDFQITKSQQDLSLLLQIIKTIGIDNQDQQFYQLYKKWSQISSSPKQIEEFIANENNSKKRVKIKCHQQLKQSLFTGSIGCPLKMYSRPYERIYFGKQCIVNILSQLEKI